MASINTPNLSENVRQVIHRSPGTLSKLYVRVTASTTSAPSTVVVRNNAADTALTLTIDAGATGVFEDTTHTVTVAAGDKLSYKVVSGGTGTMSISVFSCQFEASTGAATRLSNGPATSVYNLDNVTRFAQLVGTLTPNTATESVTKTRITKPGTIRNLSVSVTTNARTSATTIRSRKNGVDGNITLTIPAAPGIGWFEDLVNSDTVAPGDDYGWTVITGSGAGETLGIASMSCDFVETVEGVGLLVVGGTAGHAQAANTTRYIPVGGNLVQPITTEADTKIKTRDTFTLSNMTVFTSVNAVTAGSTLRLRINGAPGNQVVTIPASTSSVISDTTHTDIVAATDEIDYELVTGATGTSMTVRNISMIHGLLQAPVITTGRGTRQGRSPLYRLTKPKIVAVIIRLKVQLEYEVTRLTITVAIPYIFEKVNLIKYASAVITPLVNVLPLRKRPTPKAVVRTIITQLPYEVQTLRLRSACAYEVDKLITRKKQIEILRIAMNYLVSDFTSYTNR